MPATQSRNSNRGLSLRRSGNRSSFKTYMSRASVSILALILCMSLLPTSALATNTTELKATLTIVFGLNADKTPDLAVNKTYSFSEGETFEDLLDGAVAAKDIEAYELNSSGFAKSVTKNGGIKLETAEDWATYWSTYVDNTYYGGGDSIATMALESGKAYQLVWDSYPTAVAPDWTALAEPTQGSGIVGADGSEQSGVGSASLTIVHGLDFTGNAQVLANTNYSFAAGTTLKDLLDNAVSQSDISAYSLNDYGFAESFTSNGTQIKNAANFSTYWSLYVDGAYYAGSDSVATLALEDDKAYQFAWESYPLAMAPDWSLVSTPDKGSDDDEEPTSEEQPAAEFSQEKFSSLFKNISVSYDNTGEDWKALEMAAIGKAEQVDLSAVKANAVLAFNEPDTTNLQRSILNLTALGIDATKLKHEGKTYNLIKALATESIAHNTANGKMFALLAYASGSYKLPKNAIQTTNELIESILSLQNSDGGWSFSGDTSDADMTAIALSALALYRTDNEAVETAIKTGLATLKEMQLASGGFASLYTPGKVDVSSTSMVIIALSSLGIDTQTWVAKDQQSAKALAASNKSASSATPLTDLLSQANKAEDGFLYGGKTNDLATEQGFRALVAYQGYLNQEGAFNIYTDAGKALAAISPDADNPVTPKPDPQPDPQPDPDPDPDPDPKPVETDTDSTDNGEGDNSDEGSESTDAGSLPKTGDDAGAWILMSSVLSLCALACLMRYAQGLRRVKVKSPAQTSERLKK